MGMFVTVGPLPVSHVRHAKASSSEPQEEGPVRAEHRESRAAHRECIENELNLRMT